MSKLIFMDFWQPVELVTDLWFMAVPNQLVEMKVFISYKKINTTDMEHSLFMNIANYIINIIH